MHFTSRKIDWLAIPTKNRPANLYKCLISYLTNIESNGRIVDVLISDDSSHDEKIQSNKKVIQILSKRFISRIHYFGLEEKQALAKDLVSMVDIDPLIIKFALFGNQGAENSYGANRNNILLRTAGGIVFSADDDTLCSVRAKTNFDIEAPPTIGISLPHRFYMSRHAALTSLRRQKLDLFKVHESLIGRNVTELYTGKDKKRGLVQPENSPDLSGSIFIVNNGIAGDSGYLSSVGLISSDDEETMNRQLETQFTYKNSLNSREVIRQTEKLQIGPSHLFMSTAYSFVNNGGTPPFYPSCRNEDGILAHFLKHSFPDLHIVNLPLSILHAPRGKRTYNNPNFQFRFSEMLISIYHYWNCVVNTPVDGASISKFALYLIEIASQRTVDFEASIKHMINFMLRRRREFLIELLTLRGFSPEYWAADMRRQILLIERAITCGEIQLDDCSGTQNGTKISIDVVAYRVRCFGLLIQQWSVIFTASKMLFH